MNVVLKNSVRIDYKREYFSLIEENRRLTTENNRLYEENKQLRKIFNVGVEQFDNLNKQVGELKTALDLEKAKNKDLERTNKILSETLLKEEARANKFADMLFGLKSEKLKLSDIKDSDITDSSMINIRRGNTKTDNKLSAGKSQKKKKSGGQPGHKGSGRKIPQNLPTIDNIIDLPPGVIFHGIPSEQWIEQPGMEEVSKVVRKITLWYNERIIRKSYKPPEWAGKDVPPLIRAPIPDRISPQGKYGDEVWADIIINKYLHHIPIQRQTLAAQMEGINLIPGTVFGTLKTIYETHLVPLYEQLISELKDSSHWHADETRWNMFLCKNMKKLWYMWGFISDKVTVFILDPTRAAEVPAKTLFGIKLTDITEPLKIAKEKLKILNVDRYSAYKTLQNIGLVILSFCWAHVRRDFTDIIKKYPNDNKLTYWARRWLLKIANLYNINNKRVKHLKDDKIFLEYDTKLRDAIEQIEKQINIELQEQQKITNPMGYKIIESMKNHWDGLTLFVQHPEIPMDNNKMENTIRICALGRKNYIGNRSQWGGNFAACVYSIIQSCKQNNINPKNYLLFYFTQSAKAKGNMTTEQIKNILPHNLKEDIIDKYDLRFLK